MNMLTKSMVVSSQGKEISCNKHQNFSPKERKMGNSIKGKDLIKSGFPQDNAVNIALGLISRYKKKESKDSVLAELKEVLHFPDAFIGDGLWGKIAEGLIAPVEVK